MLSISALVVASSGKGCRSNPLCCHMNNGELQCAIRAVDCAGGAVQCNCRTATNRPIRAQLQYDRSKHQPNTSSSPVRAAAVLTRLPHYHIPLSTLLCTNSRDSTSHVVTHYATTVPHNSFLLSHNRNACCHLRTQSISTTTSRRPLTVTSCLSLLSPSFQHGVSTSNSPVWRTSSSRLQPAASAPTTVRPTPTPVRSTPIRPTTATRTATASSQTTSHPATLTSPQAIVSGRSATSSHCLFCSLLVAVLVCADCCVRHAAVRTWRLP